MANINPVPQDKISECVGWREWATKITTYIQGQQKGDQIGNLFNVPKYTTAQRPSAIAGTMYFDTTTTKFMVCEISGTWKTITTT